MTDGLVVAGTGHRPDRLGGYGDDVFERLVVLATEYLESRQPKVVISGMALGWDQALAQAALNLRLRLVAACPFDGFHEKWPPPAQARFRGLLRDAYETVYVSEPGYAAWKMHARNRYMVDRCHELVALWDGSVSGTYRCIEYAVEHQPPRQVMNLWKRWLQLGGQA